MKLTSKAKAGSIATLLLGALTWILVSFVPAWHHGLPVTVAAMLPALVAFLAGLIAALLKKEGSQVSVAEEIIARVEAAAGKVEADVAKVEQAIQGLLASK